MRLLCLVNFSILPQFARGECEERLGLRFSCPTFIRKVLADANRG